MKRFYFLLVLVVVAVVAVAFIFSGCGSKEKERNDHRSKGSETGYAEVNHVVDCDATPYAPDGLDVAEEALQISSRVCGQLKWDPAKVKLYFSPSPGQRHGKYINGYDFCQELTHAGQPVLKANVLDYLLCHPEVIPEGWKPREIFFLGTVYRESSGSPCVRYLYWNAGRWCWGCRWLDADWSNIITVALG